MKESVYQVVSREIKNGENGCVIRLTNGEFKTAKQEYNAIANYCEEMLEDEFHKNYKIVLTPKKEHMEYCLYCEFHELS